MELEYELRISPYAVADPGRDRRGLYLTKSDGCVNLSRRDRGTGRSAFFGRRQGARVNVVLAVS
jgi:hypothetical protein